MLDLILRLRDEDKAVVVVSHAMDHVMEVADRAVVMRRGRKVGELIPSAETYTEIVSLIVGGGELSEPRPHLVGVDRRLAATAGRAAAASERIASRGREPHSVASKGRTMSKKRLAAADRPRRSSLASVAAVATVTASAKPAKQQAHRQARLHHEVPGRLLLHARRRREEVGEGDTGASASSTPGQGGTDDAGEIAAIQNMVAQGVKGIAITPTSPAVIPALDKAVKAGVKVVLMDNDLPTWKKKSSVVATNNFKGGKLAGQVPRQEAQGGRHARHPRGQSRRTRRSTTA